MVSVISMSKALDLSRRCQWSLCWKPWIFLEGVNDRNDSPVSWFRMLLLWWNSVNESSWGGEGMQLMLPHLIHIEGSQGWNSARVWVWMQEGCRRYGGLLLLLVVPHVLLILLSYGTLGDQFRASPIHKGWVIPYQSLIKKTYYRLSYSSILYRHFPSWGYLLSDDSSLYQVVIKRAR